MDPTDENEVADNLRDLIETSTAYYFVDMRASLLDDDTGLLLETAGGQRFRVDVTQED